MLRKSGRISCMVATVLFYAGITISRAADFDFDQGADIGQAISRIADASAVPLLPPPVGSATPVLALPPAPPTPPVLALPPAPIAPPVFALPPAKEWTIMVFVNGKNDLSPFAVSDINEMEKVGSTDKVNIVVELGRMASHEIAGGGQYANYYWDDYDDYYNMDWRNPAPLADGNKEANVVKRLLIKKDSDTSAITSPAVLEFQQRDMGNWENLADFGKWAKMNYPAKKYMLIVWNHGSGWKRAGAKGISYDQETGNHISTADLAKAINSIGRLDVYGSDACLMQMAGVAYEIKDNAAVVVGSEETEPGDGYAYDLFLAKVTAEPSAGPEKVGIFAVDSYVEYYSAKGKAVTQSAVRAASMPGLMRLAGEWADLAMQANEPGVIKTARFSTQKYSDADYRDLSHFVLLVGSSTRNPALEAKSVELVSYIGSALVIKNGTVGRYAPNSSGISVYLPAYSYNANYDNLAWARDSRWDEFLKWILTFK
ncbi:MAG: clostripain-related cysteine peptidase [bacterium]